MTAKDRKKYISLQLQIAAMYGIIEAMLQDISKPKRQKHMATLAKAQDKGIIEPLNLA